jgi:hypothetical protein
VHERTKHELAELLKTEINRVSFIRDRRYHKALFRCGDLLPEKIAYLTVGYLSRIITQLEARRLAAHLIKFNRIEVLHQPIPVSPKEPSALVQMGVPVVIGPMNGGMRYPPGFIARSRSLNALSLFTRAAQSLSEVIHFFFLGSSKRR